MKKIILLLLLCSICTVFSANAQQSNPDYNKALADSLGADDYGMRMYVLVMLKTGSNKTFEKPVKDSLFMGHLQNIKRLADAGKLVVAGPMKKNEKTYEGIFILTVKNTADAKELLKTDPAISAQLLDVELYEWYGSAALPMYLPYYKQIAKKKM